MSIIKSYYNEKLCVCHSVTETTLPTMSQFPNLFTP